MLLHTGETNYASLSLEDINASEPITVKIHPIVTNISYLYLSLSTFPSSELYSKIRILRFTRTYEDEGETKTENIDYQIPDNLLYYNNQIYDEFYLDYETQTCQITKRCKYNSDGTVGALDNEVINTYEYPTIDLGDGDYTISLLGYNSGYLFVRLMASNIYTTQFATKVELNSAITQVEDSIELSVSQTLTNYVTTTDMNTAINVSKNSILSTVSTTYYSKNQTDAKLEDYSTKSYTNSQIQQSAGEINARIDEMEDLTDEIQGTKTIVLQNCIEGAVVELHIYGNNEVFEHLKISDDLIISDTLTLYGDSDIIVTDSENNSETYSLGVIDTLRQNGDIKDEYILKNGKAKVIRRIARDGSVLQEEQTEDLGEMVIPLKQGNNTITIKTYSAILNSKFAISNEFTNIFATQVQMQSSIKATTDAINLTVSRKVDETEIISKINQSAEEIQISADKIDIDGKAVHFRTKIDETLGQYTEDDVDRVRSIIMGEIYPTESDYEKYDIDGNITITTGDMFKIRKAIVNNNGYIEGDGTFEINPYSMKKTLAIWNEELNDYSCVLSLYSSSFYEIISKQGIYLGKDLKTHITDYHYTFENDKGYVSMALNGSLNNIPCQVFSLTNKTFEINSSIVMHTLTYNLSIYNNSKAIIDLYGGSGTGTIITEKYISTPQVTQTSLEENKKNFEKFDKALDIINNIDIYKYNLKDEEENTKKHIGFVIGDNYKYSQEVTSYNNDGVDIYSFVSVCCKAIQELQEEIKSLKGGK